MEFGLLAYSLEHFKQIYNTLNIQFIDLFTRELLKQEKKFVDEICTLFDMITKKGFSGLMLRPARNTSVMLGR